MALPTNTQTTYGTNGIRENLNDFIANISPTDVPFTANIGTTDATNTYFEWLLDTLDAPNTNNAALEGDDLNATVVVPPSRVGNRCQISTKGVIVAGTTEAVKKAGRSSELAYETRKRTLELKRDVESILVQNQASVIGNAGVARRTAGLESWFATNVNRGTGGANGGFTGGIVASPTDGTQRALTESLLKTTYQTVWTAGGNPNLLMVYPGAKVTISTFTGNVTRMEDTSDRMLATAVDVYESDFGAVKIVPNRFQRTRTVFLLQTDLWKVAFLRPYQLKDIAATGDATKKELLVEYGLMSMNEAGSGVIADLL